MASKRAGIHVAYLSIIAILLVLLIRVALVVPGEPLGTKDNAVKDLTAVARPFPGIPSPRMGETGLGQAVTRILGNPSRFRKGGGDAYSAIPIPVFEQGMPAPEADLSVPDESAQELMEEKARLDREMKDLGFILPTPDYKEDEVEGERMADERSNMEKELFETARKADEEGKRLLEQEMSRLVTPPR